MRAIEFDNVFNFRDLGGYRTADGRTVRWHRLYRADDLCRLDGADLDRFAALGIRTVLDLRRPNELEERGRIPASDGFEYRHIHVKHSKWEPADFTAPDSRTAYLVDRYLEMAELGGEGIAEALRVVADPAAAPLVFHCVAGKDRTGLVAAFTLHLLGVSDEDIADDYARSELSEAPNWAWQAQRRPDPPSRRWEEFTVSPRDAILRFFSRVRDEHGSIPEYLQSIGVTRAHAAAMREHLLTGTAAVQR
jgi:protein-tyrosine phosphatase